MKKEKITKGTIIRTTLLILALINQILYMNGQSPLPINDEQIEAIVTNGATIVTSLLAWWNNNSFSQKAIKSDRQMKG